MKVDEFIFLSDFVILYIEEDKDVPIIVEQPFLAIGRTLINVAAEELIMTANDEQMVFNIFKAMEYQEIIDVCFAVNIITKVQERN